jgi:peptidoglycan hydrolase CwlO-like protein
MQQQPATVQEIATPVATPQTAAPTLQQPTTASAIPPPPIHNYQQQNGMSPKPPRLASPAASPKPSTKHIEESNAELLSLRDAHQKLQAEVVSLRAKAASVSDEEQEVQKEISQLASAIGKLSMELSELKEGVMEARVKLTESVGTLKVQMEKKESLENQVAEARQIHEALTSANEAVSDANEFAETQNARAVASAAAAREEEEEAAASIIPPPQPQPAVMETADLFSWEAGPPAPAATTTHTRAATAPVPAMDEGYIGEVTPTPTTSSHAIEGQHDAGGLPAWGADAHSVPQVPTQQQQPAAWGSDAHSVLPGSVAPTEAGGPPTWGTDAHSVLAAQREWGAPVSNNVSAPPTPGFSGMAPMGGGGGGDLYGAPAVGSPPPPAPMLQPQGSFESQQQPQPPKSPTRDELEAVKTEALQAEKSFRNSLDLVRNISSEVTQLETNAKKAESEMKAIESKTHKKGSFVGGKKKKAKKEYEKAMEVAQAERNKVKEARDQLAMAEKEAEKAKKEMEGYKTKYEQMEMEAATAASYLSAQQQQPTPAQHMAAGGQPPAPAGYDDPFGMIQQQYAAPPSGDQFGMGLMGGAPGYGGDGGGDYANPFAM